MGELGRVETGWTVKEFMNVHQGVFGDLWRYELIDGEIVGQAAPAPLHGELIATVALALGTRLRGHPCKLEIGSGAVPREQQRPTARIPDLLVRCAGLPRVIIEVVSPSDLRKWRERDRKRRDEQDVEGAAEIVELYQSEPSAHVYRREAEARWMFEAVGGMDGVIRLESLGLDLPLAEIYEGVDLAESA